MKRTGLLFLFLLALLFLSPKLKAQGTLQFNQVLLVKSGPITVPTGKVWKIENVMVPKDTYIKFDGQTGGSCGCNSGGGYAHYNYANYPVVSLSPNNLIIDSKPFEHINDSPMWLPEGTQVEPYSITTPVQQSTPASGCYCPYWIDGVWVGYGPYTPPQVTITSWISVLEFNVIP